MKKETVIRQNRCDQEMNFLLFICYFFFMALQLFAAGTQQDSVMNLNMLLYVVFVPGFLLYLGYCFRRIAVQKTQEQGKRQILYLALRYYVYYMILALGQDIVQNGTSVGISFVRILSMTMIPSVAAVFFTMAILLVLVWVFYDQLYRMSSEWKKMALAAALCLLCAFLRSKGDCYAVFAALTGSSSSAAVPGIPYFAFFLAGMWIEKEKPGFRWNLFLGTAAVTVVSLLLYRTPLGSLCRITISLFPVYLVYVTAEEILSELTLRFRTVKFIGLSIEPVFWVYSGLLFGIAFFLDDAAGLGTRKALVIAAAVILLIYVGMLGFMAFRYLYGKAAERLLRVKHKMAAYFIIYTIAFALLMLLAFAGLFLTGRTFIWDPDGVTQYYPRAVYFAKYIRELVAGLLQGNFELPMYDFKLGMGGEITYSLEPLYFLFALFGEDKVEFTYNLVTVLRFYLAGITSSIFFLYLKKDYHTTFLASVVYVFCGFSLFGGARHTMFMIPMIMLPLLIIAVEEIIRNKRWYLCTIFVAVSLLSNYYYLYMNTFAMGIYFLVRFFCQKEKEKRTFRNFLTDGLTISGSYLLGVAMSCIVLVTTFGLYVGSGRSGASVIKTPSLFYYGEDWPMRCFLSFLTTANSPGEWMKLGFLPIAFLAVVFLFARKGRKELKILSLITGILMMLPLTGFVTSGFSSVINRWCYVIAFLVACIVADCLEDMKRMGRRDILICGWAVALYGFFAFFGTVLVTRYAKFAFIFLVITFLVVLAGQERIRSISQYTKQCLMIVLTFVLVAYNGFSLFCMANVYQEYTVYGEARERTEDSPLVAVAELEDDSFYRVSSPKLDYDTISSSIMLDYNSLSMFNSTLNGNIMEYLETMGCTAYSVTQLMGLSNRTFLNALAAVKYYAYYEKPSRSLPYGYEEVLQTEANGRETFVFENQYALPLGYTYEETISEEELEAYEVQQRQEVLMQRVMLDSGETTGDSDVQISGKTLEFSVTDADGITLQEDGIYSEKEKASITFSFEGEPNSETYLILKNAVLKGDTSEDPINLTFKTTGDKVGYKFRSNDDRYGSGQQDYVFNLGYHEDAITTCELIMSREGVINFDSIEVYSQSMDHAEQYIEDLSEDVLENVVMDTNQITGTISLDEDKILVLSIPYQKGWTAYVDGEKTELSRANYMYMALSLEAGEHTIELTYEIPGVRYALVIMPGAFLLFVLLCIVSWIKKKRKNSFHKKPEE
jgi:uncharacterized membrane protein YfhO